MLKVGIMLLAYITLDTEADRIYNELSQLTSSSLNIKSKPDVVMLTDGDYKKVSISLIWEKQNIRSIGWYELQDAVAVQDRIAKKYDLRKFKIVHMSR